ncbi:MAG: hypothetical protein WCB99_03660 [Candidatus Cybelea sp.]
MKILIPLFVIASILASVNRGEAAQTHISCSKTTISKIYAPTGPSGAGTGRVFFRDGRSAQLSGAPYGPDWRRLRIGDQTLVCADTRPMTVTDHYRTIGIVDYTANLIFTSDMGPEGA